VIGSAGVLRYGAVSTILTVTTNKQQRTILEFILQEIFTVPGRTDLARLPQDARPLVVFPVGARGRTPRRGVCMSGESRR
jgi:hypothetical protein